MLFQMYVSGNNLYYQQNVDDPAGQPITSDGDYITKFNGIPDWLYEGKTYWLTSDSIPDWLYESKTYWLTSDREYITKFNGTPDRLHEGKTHWLTSDREYITRFNGWPDWLYEGKTYWLTSRGDYIIRFNVIPDWLCVVKIRLTDWLVMVTTSSGSMWYLTGFLKVIFTNLLT